MALVALRSYQSYIEGATLSYVTFGYYREGECHGQMVVALVLQRGRLSGSQSLATPSASTGWSEKIGIAVEDD
jgi:hypothetical protein